MRRSINYFTFTLFILASYSCFSHSGEKHDKAKEAIVNDDKVNGEINQSYIDEIRPIFKMKCFDCHGKSDLMPWYYKLPGVKQLIDYDINEAKEHLDMTNDFPFKGHGSTIEDLEELKEVIIEDSMPIWRYLIMHPQSKLTKAEKDMTLKWIDKSLNKLKGE